MRIGEVAEQAGLRKSAIRYYEEIGLLPEPERVSGQRVYGPSVLRRLALIDVSQRAGLSLDEIRELLDAGSGADRPAYARASSEEASGGRGPDSAGRGDARLAQDRSGLRL